MPGAPINGWNAEEIDRLVRRTSKPRELVEEFCRAVDKRLFLLLDERQRRSTLHFHLGVPETADPREEK
jgi:hypothetical protein